MKFLKRTTMLAAALLLLLLAACAPGTQQVTAGPHFAVAYSPAEEAALNTAKAIWHRMEAGKIQTGSYTSNVLVDLVDLPQGVAFRMETFPGESFEMRVTDDALPTIWWIVDPSGVTRHQGRA